MLRPQQHARGLYWRRGSARGAGRARTWAAPTCMVHLLAPGTLCFAVCPGRPPHVTAVRRVRRCNERPAVRRHAATCTGAGRGGPVLPLPGNCHVLVDARVQDGWLPALPFAVPSAFVPSAACLSCACGRRKWRRTAGGGVTGCPRRRRQWRRRRQYRRRQQAGPGPKAAVAWVPAEIAARPQAAGGSSDRARRCFVLLGRAQSDCHRLQRQRRCAWCQRQQRKGFGDHRWGRGQG